MPKARQALTEKEAGWEEKPASSLALLRKPALCPNRGAYATLHAYHPIGREVNAE
jgi:hypothetical protein